MTTKKVAVLLGFMSIAFATSGAVCGGDDACESAKQHMCEKIPDMGCSAAFMDTAQQKIVDACGQAELAAYLPVVQSACNAAEASGLSMNCGAIAGKTYAAPESDAGSGCGTSGSMSFSYGGSATADGRAAQLSFTISGTTVIDGKLYASAVCEPSVHLNSTNVAFVGSLSGSWESPGGTINASWTGGDYACDGTHLTPDMGYPQSGSLTISMLGNKVGLQRNISAALPYEFSASGRTYLPACAPTPPDAGTGGGGDTRVSSDTRTSADVLGPVCTKLALCCPTITDIPGLQSDCYKTLENGLGDSGCQITWDSITRLGYCEGI